MAERNIPRCWAGVVIVGFVAGALFVGLTAWINDDARAAITFPIIIATLLLALKDLLKREIRWEAVANALLAVAAAMLIGFHNLANAKSSSVWAGVIYSVTVLGLVFLFGVFASRRNLSLSGLRGGPGPNRVGPGHSEPSSNPEFAVEEKPHEDKNQ